MKLHAVAMPRQRDIGGVAIQSRRREHLGTVRRHTLCLMDCGGITVIDGGIFLCIESDGSAVVQCSGHSVSRDASDRAPRAGLYGPARSARRRVRKEGVNKI